MTSMNDYLDRMVISVTSPDRNIRARVSNQTDVEIEFQPGSFDRYDEAGLGHQLGRLGVTTWIAYERGRDEAYRRSLARGATELEDRPDEDPRRLRYREAVKEIEGEANSAGGAIRVRTNGMAQWSVDIEPGSIRRLGRERFLAEINSAVESLLEDRRLKITLLRSEHFDMGVPQRWWDLVARWSGGR